MAAIAGKGGNVKVGAAIVAEIREWSLDLGADNLETTKFGQDWKTFVQGLKEWSGSFSGRWDMTDTAGQKALQDAFLGGTTVTISLLVDATHNYSGDALITPSVNVAVDGLAEISFDFQGTGPLTYA